MVEAGLILEGGGMRGTYTTGVLDLLMDADLYFRHVYGVSAGACHACSYGSRQRGRAVRTVTDYLDDQRYAGVRSLVRTGDYFGVQMIYDEIPNRLIPFDYDAFLHGGMELTAVLTDCVTGQAEYVKVGDLRRDMTVIRASSSLPLLSKSVQIGGKSYLDGGIADSIPLARSISDGNRKNLVVLTRHRGYRKGPGRMNALIGLGYRKYPELVESAKTRHLRYNQALDLIEEQERRGNVFVIQPQAPLEIGRLERDRDKLLALHRQGYDDARALLSALRRFLEGAGEARRTG